MASSSAVTLIRFSNWAFFCVFIKGYFCIDWKLNEDIQYEYLCVCVCVCAPLCVYFDIEADPEPEFWTEHILSTLLYTGDEIRGKSDEIKQIILSQVSGEDDDC